MRAFKAFPSIRVKLAKLSKDGLKRLNWMDWYLNHGNNAQLTCRHFGISKSVFYRWKNRFNKYDLTTLEFDTKLRTPHRLRQMQTSKEVIDYFPFKIRAINTDNGPEYLLNFHKLCEELCIPHYFNTPHTPTMNSRAERLIQTAEYEYFNYQYDLLPTLKEINLRCEIFNDKYNNKRFHHSLDYQTPSEYVTNYQTSQKGDVYVI